MADRASGMVVQFDEVDGLCRDVEEALGQEKDVLFAYLFGSVASGTAHRFSDIDVAVYLRPREERAYYLRKEGELWDRLYSKLRTDRTDLTLLNVAPLVLRFRVISEGIRVFSRDEQARVDFETEVLYRYFDLKPYLDLQWTLIQERILAGT